MAAPNPAVDELGIALAPLPHREPIDEDDPRCADPAEPDEQDWAPEAEPEDRIPAPPVAAAPAVPPAAAAARPRRWFGARRRAERPAVAAVPEPEPPPRAGWNVYRELALEICAAVLALSLATAAGMGLVLYGLSRADRPLEAADPAGKPAVGSTTEGRAQNRIDAAAALFSWPGRSRLPPRLSQEATAP